MLIKSLELISDSSPYERRLFLFHKRQGTAPSQSAHPLIENVLTDRTVPARRSDSAGTAPAARSWPREDTAAASTSAQ